MKAENPGWNYHWKRDTGDDEPKVKARGKGGTWESTAPTEENCEKETWSVKSNAIERTTN